jgi:hypothetical protein
VEGRDLIEGNGDSRRPAINGNGTQIAFTSAADNLVPLDCNGVVDVLVGERTTVRADGETLPPCLTPEPTAPPTTRSPVRPVPTRTEPTRPVTTTAVTVPASGPPRAQVGSSSDVGGVVRRLR